VAVGPLKELDLQMAALTNDWHDPASFAKQRGFIILFMQLNIKEFIPPLSLGFF
jgi:hypothetical protein